MTQLIDKKVVLEAVKALPAELDAETVQRCIEILSNQPTVDAVSDRHGKWELAKDGWYCSACELYPPFDCDPEEKGIPYCPNCGARMDDGKE